MNDWPIFQ